MLGAMRTASSLNGGGWVTALGAVVPLVGTMMGGRSAVVSASVSFDGGTDESRRSVARPLTAIVPCGATPCRVPCSGGIPRARDSGERPGNIPPPSGGGDVLEGGAGFGRAPATEGGLGVIAGGAMADGAIADGVPGISRVGS
jgi:hypothetical protein